MRLTYAKIIVAFLLCLLLPGCLVQTDNFLSDRETSQVDQRLIGVWTVPGNQDETGFLFVRAAEEGGGMEVITLSLRDNEDTNNQEPDWDIATFWPTEIAGLGYLNMIMEDGNLIIAYKVNDDGSVELGPMKNDPFKTAIEAGKLKGTISKSFLGQDVRLTDTAENIKAFIRDNGGHDLFEFRFGEDNKEKLLVVRHRLEK